MAPKRRAFITVICSTAIVLFVALVIPTSAIAGVGSRPSVVGAVKQTSTATSATLSWWKPPAGSFSGLMIRRISGTCTSNFGQPTSGTLISKVPAPGRASTDRSVHPKRSGRKRGIGLFNRSRVCRFVSNFTGESINRRWAQKPKGTPPHEMFTVSRQMRSRCREGRCCTAH
jgi:hypothetical protein